MLQPYRWNEKHDDLLRIAFRPGQVDEVLRYLELHHLLACSKEWIIYRIAQLGLQLNDNVIEEEQL